MGKPSDKKKRTPKSVAAAKKQTKSGKQHTFEPFSHRIARLKIDPVRRSGHRAINDEDLVNNDSYFKAALEKWRELNLSEHFCFFIKEVELLCDSLPQLLHHEDFVVDTLIKYLQNGTVVSLEPLLDLVVHLAHDLGSKFESHFARTVEVINRIAGSIPEFEAIEWSFNCLAWLFKYLSKLLVLDLRPLFDLMAPLIGKKRQKEFVMRFAAEAFSFLIRRAAVSYHKNKRPVQKIVKHILQSLHKEDQEEPSQPYLEALATLFGEAISGVNGEISANGEFIFHELLTEALKLHETSPTSAKTAYVLVYYVLESLAATLQHQSLAQLLEVIIHNSRYIDADFVPHKEDGSLPTIDNKITCQRASVCTELLLLPVATNHGKAIQDWKSILDLIDGFVNSAIATPRILEAAPQILALLVASHYNAPTDIAIKYTKVFSTITRQPWRPYFLGVCEIYAELDCTRFMTFLGSEFKR
jgi:U3 small nucleolar RNA-associated protein 20